MAEGHNYGTIIVDLERREVVEVLADRSAATTASWFKDHPDVEVVTRDRARLYAEAAREGAPQARQVADRFHLLQNFRETVERQLGGYEAPIQDSRISGSGNPAPSALPARLDCRSDAVTQTRLILRERHALRQQLFDEIRALFEGGSSVGEIARKLGLGRRRVEPWVRRIDLADRSTIASTPSSPAYFGVLLERRWAEGITKVRHLFAEIRHRGYTGSFSHLARFLAPWRSGAPSLDDDEQEAPASADRGGALCQTPRPDDRPAGRQRRCAKSGVCRVHNDAALGDAVSRLASRWNDGEVGRLADRRTRVWDLCDAPFREDDTPGSGSRSKRRIGAVEQRANRRTDQQIENPQASHVRPRRR